MKKKNSIFVWIIVSIIILAILLVILIAPIFTVDLHLSDCSNVNLQEVTTRFEQLDIPSITQQDLEDALGECITNAGMMSLDLALYLTVKGLPIDNITSGEIPSGDRIKVNNLKVDGKFVTVSFNARKLFELDINGIAGTIKVNKNLIGTMYRY